MNLTVNKVSYLLFYHALYIKNSNIKKHTICCILVLSEKIVYEL